MATVLVIAWVAVAGADSLRCDYCSQWIRGNYMISDGKNYHTSCYENHIALRCALCKGIINGRYLEDYWGNKVHIEHKEEVPQCEYCRRFISENISGGGVRYDDGRMVCNICYRSAIRDAVKAESIMSNLQDVLAEYEIVTANVDVPLYLVNRNTMSELAAGFHADPLGFAHYEKTSYAGGLITDKSYKIYMMIGIPRYEFISALAHELMHIWLFNNAPPEIDPDLREGSCNYAAYLILREYSNPEAKFVIENMLKDPDPVYGDGFRRVKKMVERNGISYWLNYIKNHKTSSR